MFAVRDAKWFRKESERCLAQADETICLSSRAQWLLFSDEWMGHAEIAETSAAINLGDRLVRAELRTGAGREKVTRVALTLKSAPCSA
jgi:hypothetical protein